MRCTLMRCTLICLGFILTSSAASAETQCSASATDPVVLVELFTSEGCSSCPPADRWLSNLARSNKVPTRVVPLALHVPYWDYIGWRDPFSSPLFEQRQRLAVVQGRSPTVFTPQLMANGRNLSNWSGEGLERFLSQAKRAGSLATLKIASVYSAQDIQVTVTGKAPPGANVVLARYENQLVTEVRAGENAGERLSHDHVTREWIELGRADSAGSIQLSHKLPLRRDIKLAQSGLVAFVQNSGEVLQAVMLAVCGPTGSGPAM